MLTGLNWAEWTLQARISPDARTTVAWRYRSLLLDAVVLGSIPDEIASVSQLFDKYHLSVRLVKDLKKDRKKESGIWFIDPPSWVHRISMLHRRVQAMIWRCPRGLCTRRKPVVWLQWKRGQKIWNKTQWSCGIRCSVCVADAVCMLQLQCVLNTHEPDICNKTRWSCGIRFHIWFKSLSLFIHVESTVSRPRYYVLWEDYFVPLPTTWHI